MVGVKVSIILLFALLSFGAAFKDCNFSQFDFFSHYSLGRSDELNRTFQKVNDKMGAIPSVQLKTDRAVTYRISDASVRFRYIDSQQKAEVVSGDIIYVSGAKAQTNINFTWFKDQIQGSGIANCMTDKLSFAKLLYINQGFMSFKLADNNNVTYFTSNCSISRVDPVLQSAQVVYLTELLNSNGGSNVKTLIAAEAMKSYQQALNGSLYDQRYPIQNQFQYNWTSPNNNITINYTMLPTGAHLSTDGLYLNFVTQITDDELWKCGASVPSSPRDPKAYGGIQEYLSMSIIQNTIRFASQKGVLNTVLNQEKWQSKSFQFFAGDLYDVIPQLAKSYYAATPVEGSCNISSLTDVQTSIINSDTFSVSLPYSCQLYIKTTLISSFEVEAKFQVQIIPQSDRLEFRVVKTDKMAQFKDVGIYKIHDIQLANYFLSRTLAKAKEGHVFGSGWKIYTRDYPQVLLENGYLFIYDAAATS